MRRDEGFDELIVTLDLEALGVEDDERRDKRRRRVQQPKAKTPAPARSKRRSSAMDTVKGAGELLKLRDRVPVPGKPALAAVTEAGSEEAVGADESGTAETAAGHNIAAAAVEEPAQQHAGQEAPTAAVAPLRTAQTAGAPSALAGQTSSAAPCLANMVEPDNTAAAADKEAKKKEPKPYDQEYMDTFKYEDPAVKVPRNKNAIGDGMKALKRKAVTMSTNSGLDVIMFVGHIKRERNQFQVYGTGMYGQEAVSGHRKQLMRATESLLSKLYKGQKGRSDELVELMEEVFSEQEAEQYKWVGKQGWSINTFATLTAEEVKVFFCAAPTDPKVTPMPVGKAVQLWTAAKEHVAPLVI